MVYQFQQASEEPLLSGHLNLGGANPEGEQIQVTSRYLTRGGKPWIPVMGEFHFSRCPRSEWFRELCKMKAGGITLVSTYLFWIYHEELEGEYDFEGDRDIRAFVEEAREAGLEVVLRIGPWAHGECRNGGFPDWLLRKPYALRENNPEYLAMVRKWYGRIAREVEGLLYKDGGNIVAIQLENEYVGNAAHLATLKQIALEGGMEVPLYTVTGWNSASGAKIPVEEVLPVFGGYCEAPWENHTEKLAPSPHYFFNRMRNDSAIGADLMARGGEEEWQLPYEKYPFATCELGGGIQITHHRRPIIRPMDIYALSLVKLGDGNNLPGYYMYHGGTNKLGRLSTLQESKATGYPNDYPILSYDFQAPLSEYGEAREHYGLLNLLHLFLQDFQEDFAPLWAADAMERVTREDTTSLRLGIRTDGKRGFVFVNHYQRLESLEDVTGAVIDTGTVMFPPIDVKGEVSFFLPFGMKLASEREVLTFATAQPVCRMGNTFFFVEIPGIEAVYGFPGENGSDSRAEALEKADSGAEERALGKGQEEGRTYRVKAGRESAFQVGDSRIVTLTWEEARYLRRLERDGKSELYLGNGCNLYLCREELYSIEEGSYTCYRWDGDGFLPFELGVEPEEAARICWRESARQGTLAEFERAWAVYSKDWVTGEKPKGAGEEYRKAGQGSFKAYTEELQIGSPRRIGWLAFTVESSQDDRGFVTFEMACDVAQIYVEGRLVADTYDYGMPWRVPVCLLSGKECLFVMSERKDDFYREFL